MAGDNRQGVAIHRLIRQFVRTLGQPGGAGFGLRLILLWSPLLGVFALRPIRNLLEAPLTVGYARVVGWLFELAGIEHVRAGATLDFVGRGFGFAIDPVCTGYFVFWFYLGAVLAFPATWAARLKAIAGGAGLVFVLNVGRIVSLYHVRATHPGWFDEVHLVVWQSLVIVIVGVFWYGWASSRPADASAAA